MRYDYDPWGRRTRLSGSYDIEFGYTGHHHHEQSGLNLTWFRAYDSDLGRWLSADPIEYVTGELGEMLPEGPNLYNYVGNDPVNAIDPIGLAEITEFSEGSADLHTHSNGRGPKNPAFDIQPTKGDKGLVACKRSNHPLPKNAQDILDGNLRNRTWVEDTRRLISNQFDSVRNPHTRENLRRLGRSVRRSAALSPFWLSIESAIDLLLAPYNINPMQPCA